MTHKLRGDVVYLDPSGRDDSNRRRAMRAIVVSSAGLLVTSAFELFITVLSGSVALLSDALHNLGDVFTTVGVYFGFRASRKQPTRRYPYGYGRAEDLTGVVIVAAIWSSAALAGWQSYDKLVSGRGTTHLSLGMTAAVIGIVGNQLVTVQAERGAGDQERPPDRGRPPFLARCHRLSGRAAAGSAVFRSGTRSP